MILSISTLSVINCIDNMKKIIKSIINGKISSFSIPYLKEWNKIRRKYMLTDLQKDKITQSFLITAKELYSDNSNEVKDVNNYITQLAAEKMFGYTKTLGRNGKLIDKPNYDRRSIKNDAENGMFRYKVNKKGTIVLFKHDIALYKQAFDVAELLFENNIMGVKEDDITGKKYYILNDFSSGTKEKETIAKNKLATIVHAINQPAFQKLLQTYQSIMNGDQK